MKVPIESKETLVNKDIQKFAFIWNKSVEGLLFGQFLASVRFIVKCSL